MTSPKPFQEGSPGKVRRCTDPSSEPPEHHHYIIYFRSWQSVFSTIQVSLPLGNLPSCTTASSWRNDYSFWCALTTECFPRFPELLHNDSCCKPLTCITHLWISGTEHLWLLNQHLWNESLSLHVFLIGGNESDFSESRICMILFNPCKTVTSELPWLLAKEYPSCLPYLCVGNTMTL